MKRILVFIMALSISLFAERVKNWNGYGDVVTMPACSSTITVYSGDAFALTDFDAVRIIIQADDTTSAGFSADSVNLRWGYQTFTLCKNAAGAVDTCFNSPVVVDTMAATNFGTITTYSTDANGIEASPSQQVDTLGCAGFAVQSRTFAPEWNVYIRVWVQGIAGNKVSKKIALKATIIRRLFRGVRSL